MTYLFVAVVGRTHVKSRDDPISGRRGDSGVPYSFIYRDCLCIYELSVFDSQFNVVYNKFVDLCFMKM